MESAKRLKTSNIRQSHQGTLSIRCWWFEKLWRGCVAADDACHLNAYCTWKWTAEVYMHVSERTSNPQLHKVLRTLCHKTSLTLSFVVKNRWRLENHWTLKGCYWQPRNIHEGHLTTLDLQSLKIVKAVKPFSRCLSFAFRRSSGDFL